MPALSSIQTYYLSSQNISRKKPVSLQLLLARIVVVTCVIIFICGNCVAQQPISSSPIDEPLQAPVDSAGSKARKPVPQKDLGDVVNSILHKKPSEEKPEDSISKPIISFIAGLSYSVQTKMAYTASGNCVFRLAPGSKLSTITIGAIYTQKHQFSMPLQSSIWTKNNTWNFVGDYRFYDYPQNTYGLGSRSHAQSEEFMKFKFLRFYETGLRKIKGNFYAGVGLIADFHSKISHRQGNGQSYIRPRDTTGKKAFMSYERYGMARETKSAGFTLNLLCDTRDNAINPYKGTYLNVQYRNTLTALGSTRPWQSLIVEMRKYIHLRPQSKNVLALWSYNWLILSGKPPYLDLPATSWDAFGNTGRGYVQGRFRGTKMIYGEAEYRFGITHNGLIGGVAFANAQTLSAGPRSDLQVIRPGYGAGIRIKLNKLSRTNIAVDYGRGVQGSGGVFMTVGELF